MWSRIKILFKKLKSRCKYDVLIPTHVRRNFKVSVFSLDFGQPCRHWLKNNVDWFWKWCRQPASLGFPSAHYYFRVALEICNHPLCSVFRQQAPVVTRALPSFYNLAVSWWGGWRWLSCCKQPCCPVMRFYHLRCIEEVAMIAKHQRYFSVPLTFKQNWRCRWQSCKRETEHLLPFHQMWVSCIFNFDLQLFSFFFWCSRTATCYRLLTANRT